MMVQGLDKEHSVRMIKYCRCLLQRHSLSSVTGIVTDGASIRFYKV